MGAAASFVALFLFLPTPFAVAPAVYFRCVLRILGGQKLVDGFTLCIPLSVVLLGPALIDRFGDRGKNGKLKITYKSTGGKIEKNKGVVYSTRIRGKEKCQIGV